MPYTISDKNAFKTPNSVTTNQLEIYQWAKKKKNEPYKLVIIYKAYKRTSQNEWLSKIEANEETLKKRLKYQAIDSMGETWRSIWMLVSVAFFFFFVSFVLAFSAVRFDSVQVCIYILGLRMYNINRVAWISLLILFYFFFLLERRRKKYRMTSERNYFANTCACTKSMKIVLF